jgi:NitT/TauT family transport system substrate-binding protein
MREFPGQQYASPADWKGKVAVWFFGNEYNLLATLAKYNIDKDKDVTIVQQPFDMNLLLNKEVDAAARPTMSCTRCSALATDRVNIIDYNKEAAMPEDGISAREDWLQDAKNMTSPRASCAPRPRAGSTPRQRRRLRRHCAQERRPGVMTKEAQKWQMVEINKLVWGDPVDRPPIIIWSRSPSLAPTLRSSSA